MKIQQLLNKKIQFWEGSKIVFSCLPNQNYKVVSETEIHLINAGIKVLSLFAKDINATSILGATNVAQDFKNSQELAIFLDNNFFFELSDGGGGDNMLSSYGDTGEYNQGHSAVKPAISTSTIMTAGRIYTIPVFLGGNFIEFALIVNSVIAGIDFNFALYEGATTGNYTPTNKVFQSAEFTTSGVAERFTSIINITLNKKWYYFTYTTNGNVTFTGTRVANTFLGWSGALGLSAITRLFAAGTYASTLPAVFPAHFNDLGNPSNPILFFKKDNS